MDSSQLTGATASYAKKYALCNLFAIDDGVDADSHAPAGKTTAMPRTSVPSNKPKTISPAQLKRLQTIASVNKVPVEKVKEIIKRLAGVDSAKDISWKDYEAVCNEIEGK